MAETKSLITELPKILEKGKKEVERTLDNLSKRNRITLQTNELVLPTKAKGGLYSFMGQSVKDDVNNELLSRLIYGDNILAMQALLEGDPHTDMPSMRGKIDLIYIDPPFDSKADYRTMIHLPSTEIEAMPTVIEQHAYSDTWKDGTVSYLEMIIPRLILMRELLSEQGSIYVHIDWHVGHYVKIIMDEIFGKENFVNEIIWKRCDSHNDSNRYGVIHDVILFYQKTNSRIWNEYADTSPLPESTIKNWYNNECVVEEDTINKLGKFIPKGSIRYYNKADITGAGANPKDRMFKGVMPPSGRHWAYSEEYMLKLDQENRIHYSRSGKPYEKRFLDESKGLPPQTIWIDVPMIRGLNRNNPNSEWIDYDTQKPEALIKRMILMSSNENSIVADFFAGSGTTGAVAEKLNRKWIMADLGKPACMIMRKRLIDQDAKPFYYQSIGDYQKEQFEKSSFKTIGDLSHVVISLYGALPFPLREGIPNNLGYIKATKTLVFVDSPSKMTGYNTLRKAQELRAGFMGGWQKVVVLGWNFVTDIGKILENIKDDKLEVLVIPPDLLDQLKTKARYEKLIKTGKIKFSSLQYLTIKPIKINQENETDIIEVELDNYILLSPDALPLDKNNKEKLESVMGEDPLALIEYWSIDPDYDGETFRSKWQDYRQNTENNNYKLAVVKKAKLEVPKINKKRKICVKAVDVFGFESIAVQEII